MRLVAVDPGGTTGIARYDSAVGLSSFASFELPTLEAIESVHALLRASLVDLLVVEAFVISAATLKKTRAGSHAAIESIGALRYLAHFYSVEFDATQTAAEKRFATAARLRKLGWYYPTPGGHRNDAARHLLVAAVRRGLIDPSIFLEDS